MNKNYIVLNGKHYDAVTGALIKPVANHSQASHTRIAPTKTVGHATPARQTVTHAKSPADHPKKTVTRTHHSAPKGVHSHKQQQPKTLMRHVVKKPAHEQKPAVKQAYPLTKANSGTVIKPKTSALSVNELRSRRAQEIHKSKQVSRFALSNTTAIPTKIKPVAIKPAPAPVKPVRTAGHTIPIHHTTKQLPVKNTAPTLAERKHTLLEQALANAKSHQESAPKSTRRFKHRRLMSSLAGMAAVLVISGFVVYLNKASVELQVASVRAGFQASMPNYTPANYERLSTTASNGKVAISFVSPTQKNNFTLTQESSSWDSQTLFDSVVAQGSATYQTIQSNGRTIYLYGGDKAAWVDGGILYKITGNTSLKSDEIISLAGSM